MNIKSSDDIMMLVSHISETHRKSVQSECDIPRFDVPFHEMNGLRMQQLFANINNRISQLHADRDVCKESTDTSEKATQDECDLKPSKKVPKPAPKATCEDGKKD